MSNKAKPKTEGRMSAAAVADPSADASGGGTSKVDPSDENFEHTLRRAALEKEKQRFKNPGLYL